MPFHASRLPPLGLAAALLAACGAKPAPPTARLPLDGSHRFERICSVTVASDEMLADLLRGDFDRLAGVTYMADDPSFSSVTGVYPAAIPRTDANLEMILATDPDLVIVASYTQQSFLDMLERVGRTVFHLDEIHSFGAVFDSIERLGRAVGEPARAAAVVADAKQRLAAVAARLAGAQERPRVLFWARGFTSGANTTVGEMIERAGGINAAAAMGFRGDPPVSLEAVLAMDPDVLLVPEWDASYGGGTGALPPVFDALAAVRDGRVVHIDGKYVSTVSQYLADGTEWLARELHPDRFGAGD